jgi:flagellar biosynthesis anti-sigma factor FlgM
MRIDDQNGLGNTQSTQTGGASSAGRAGRDSNGSTASTSGSSSDSVQLSGFAGELSKSLQASSGRTQRLSELTQAVRSGTYQVDAGAISRAMVEQALSTGKGGGVS